MQEYLVRHLRNLSVWTSITIDPNDTHALVVRDTSIETVSYQTASEILAYCEQSGDFVVTTV